MHSVDVIIPAYRPDGTFLELVTELEKQSYPVSRVIIVNTGEEFFRELTEKDTDGVLSGYDNITVRHVEKKDFDHGATRNYGVSLSDAEFFLMLTQDAMPRDRKLISSLVSAMEDDPEAVAAYAKQYPKSDCSLEERYLRKFNYPSTPMRKTQADLDKLGIKTYFCSNVCALYRREIFDRLGGFPAPSIFNEDMVFIGNAMQKGYAVHYVPDAGVIHSHNYTVRQQFKRSFDLGVSQIQHPEIFEGISSESEGMRMVKETVAHFKSIGKSLAVPHYIIMCGARFMGYRLGRAYRKLPKALIYAFTMNRDYWRYAAAVQETRDGS